MAGQYENWRMSSATRDSARGQLERSLYRGVPEGTDIHGAESQIGRQRLIEEMAGTTDKQSRAWKTARDTLTRWRNGTRGIGPKNAAKVRKIAEGERRRRASRRPVHVTITGDFKTSGSRWRNGQMRAGLTGSASSDLMDAIEAGDSELAMQIAMDEYGLDPDRVEGIEHLEGIEMQFDDSEDE